MGKETVGGSPALVLLLQKRDTLQTLPGTVGVASDADSDDGVSVVRTWNDGCSLLKSGDVAEEQQTPIQPAGICAHAETIRTRSMAFRIWIFDFDF